MTIGSLMQDASASGIICFPAVPHRLTPSLFSARPAFGHSVHCARYSCAMGVKFVLVGLSIP